MVTIEIADKIFKFIKVLLITMSTYLTANKLMYTKKSIKENRIITVIKNVVVGIIYYYLKNKIGLLMDTIILMFLLTICIIQKRNENFGYIFIYVAISLTINNILFFFSSAMTFICKKILNIQNYYVIRIIIYLIFIVEIYLILKMKKLKKGLKFLRDQAYNGYFEILFFNISIIILFTIILFVNCDIEITGQVGISLIIFASIMFITIQKSLQLYYKQKLLLQELEQTKKDLEDKTKEIENLEKENITISKRNHTIDHKQKSLELKIAEMMNKSEISKEEVAEIRERLKQISKDINEVRTSTELDKTEISEIDDMLKYMQSECNKNKIDFELQIKGNIHYMTNNLISKEDLETLLADHIKNAIIAINHTDNINRSILVRLGKIDENYGLYIYDSGIEFEQETLKKLGKEPSTTHANEGGTGMGFMNTFDTLNKCKASLIIEEYNKPSKDNYTKAIFIKFDNKNEFKIKSYR